MATETKVKPANYSTEQEQAIIKAVKLATDFTSQKAFIQNLVGTPLFKEKTERQLLSKLMHMSKSKASDRPVYFPKVYEPKVGAVPVKKSVLVDELESLIGTDSGQLESLSAATKGALMLVINAVKGRA